MSNDEIIENLKQMQISLQLALYNVTLAQKTISNINNHLEAINEAIQIIGEGQRNDS